MNKFCPKCDIKMKLIPNSGREIGVYKLTNTFRSENKRGIGAEYYACPNCGLVQQYITEDSMEDLLNI